MANVSGEHSWPRRRTASVRLSGGLPNALSVAGPSLLFGLRLWASVCLALFVAFWLEFDDPYWAGTTAATVCQPQLGASLRKVWFRIIGTVTGATIVVVLTACFPRDRIAFLGILALWCSVCAFAATLLHNFASYAAALAGYTAVTIATDTLGATGGASADVFMLAVWRASAICLGIVCAGIILAGTDLGGTQRRLAALFAALAAEITDRFTGMLAQAGPELPDTQPLRRELVRRVIALDPVVDQAIGESSELRYRLPILQRAVQGLFTALDGWCGVAAHLSRLPDDMARQEAETILCSLPPELRPASEAVVPARWTADPNGLRRICDGAIGTLRALPAGTPSLRLLADETAKLVTGISHVLDGLALLVDAPDPPLRGHHKFRLGPPDWMPALVNGGRAFIAIGAVELFWVVTAWPNAGTAIFFVAATLLLLSPRPNQTHGATMMVLGTGGAIVLAAIAKFAVLPALSSFPAFCIALGLFLLPEGFVKVYSRKPPILAVFSSMPMMFMALLAPTNQMSYDTAQYYNFALALLAGSAAAVLSFRLLPPLSPALRTRRLLAFALCDLHRLAVDSLPPSPEDWEGRMYSRLAALPDEAEPLQRAQLLAALSVGSGIVQLRRISPLLGLGPELDAALAALAQGHSAMARTWLARLDHQLASLPDGEPGADLALRARARILALSETLAEHAAYFDAGEPA